MFTSFLESIKYIGHLWPLAVFRISLGYYYLMKGIQRYQEGYFDNAFINESIRMLLPESTAPGWYKYFLDSIVQENWKIFTYLLTTTEILIGLSFLLGYLVRPFALLGLLLTINLLFTVSGASGDFYFLLLITHLMLYMMGAGRCLGFDYYFYQRRRGLWW